MPGMSGLELIKELRRVRPMLPTLVLSMHPPSQFARRAPERGRDRLHHEGQQTRGVRHRHRKRAGEAGDTSARDTADLLLRQGARWESAPHESLSDREYQVLRLIGSGQTISDIGRDLGLSVKTVSTYRARVLDKLGMRTNAELMRYAIENKPARILTVRT